MLDEELELYGVKKMLAPLVGTIVFALAIPYAVIVILANAARGRSGFRK